MKIKNLFNINQRISRFKRPPRAITLIFLRILLTFPAALMLIAGRNEIAVGFFILTIFMGYIDLYFRRKQVLESQLVSILDPFADKLLILTTAFILWKQGKLLLLIFLIYFIKDIVMILGALFILKRNKKTVFKKNVLDKWTVFFQSLAIALIILSLNDNVIIWISAGLTVITGLMPMFKIEAFSSRKAELPKLKLAKLIKIPDYITFVNVIGGLFCILLSINKQYTLAVIMLIISVIADYFDGKVARALNKESEFGKELDSLADTISFGVAPAVFAFSLVPNTTLALIAFTVFILCGVIRLARYNTTTFSGNYEGMPITMNGIIIPAIYFFGVPFEYYSYIYLVLGLLMVSSISIKKL